jgi:hypothetical protein
LDRGGSYGGSVETLSPPSRVRQDLLPPPLATESPFETPARQASASSIRAKSRAWWAERPAARRKRRRERPAKMVLLPRLCARQVKNMRLAPYLRTHRWLLEVG